MTIKEEKKRIRAVLIKRMQELPLSYCQRADAAILRHILALPAYKSAHTICAYVGMKDEINTKPVIVRMLADGKRVGVPLCTGKGVMEMREIHSLRDLQAGTWGIWEPKEYTAVLPPAAIDMGLIPCVSGNASGKRLGYGGGFYDRYLSGTSFLRVILCRKQLITEQIPAEPHDEAMDILISEDGAVYCKKT